MICNIVSFFCLIDEGWEPGVTVIEREAKSGTVLSMEQASTNNGHTLRDVTAAFETSASRSNLTLETVEQKNDGNDENGEVEDDYELKGEVLGIGSVCGSSLGL